MTQYQQSKEEIIAQVVHSVAFLDEMTPRLDPEDAESFRAGFLNAMGMQSARTYTQAYKRAYEAGDEQVRPTVDSPQQEHTLFGSLPVGD